MNPVYPLTVEDALKATYPGGSDFILDETGQRIFTLNGNRGFHPVLLLTALTRKVPAPPGQIVVYHRSSADGLPHQEWTECFELASAETVSIIRPGTAALVHHDRGTQSTIYLPYREGARYLLVDDCTRIDPKFAEVAQQLTIIRLPGAQNEVPRIDYLHDLVGFSDSVEVELFMEFGHNCLPMLTKHEKTILVLLTQDLNNQLISSQRPKFTQWMIDHGLRSVYEKSPQDYWTERLVTDMSLIKNKVGENVLAKSIKNQSDYEHASQVTNLLQIITTSMSVDELNARVSQMFDSKVHIKTARESWADWFKINLISIADRLGEPALNAGFEALGHTEDHSQISRVIEIIVSSTSPSQLNDRLKQLVGPADPVNIAGDWFKWIKSFITLVDNDLLETIMVSCLDEPTIIQGFRKVVESSTTQAEFMINVRPFLRKLVDSIPVNALGKDLLNTIASSVDRLNIQPSPVPSTKTESIYPLIQAILSNLGINGLHTIMDCIENKDLINRLANIARDTSVEKDFVMRTRMLLIGATDGIPDSNPAKPLIESLITDMTHRCNELSRLATGVPSGVVKSTPIRTSTPLLDAAAAASPSSATVSVSAAMPATTVSSTVGVPVTSFDPLIMDWSDTNQTVQIDGLLILTQQVISILCEESCLGIRVDSVKGLIKVFRDRLPTMVPGTKKVVIELIVHQLIPMVINQAKKSKDTLLVLLDDEFSNLVEQLHGFGNPDELRQVMEIYMSVVGDACT